jgi:hypothetical protein
MIDPARFALDKGKIASERNFSSPIVLVDSYGASAYGSDGLRISAAGSR